MIKRLRETTLHAGCTAGIQEFNLTFVVELLNSLNPFSLLALQGKAVLETGS
jgi:hypothetical protein